MTPTPAQDDVLRVRIADELEEIYCKGWAEHPSLSSAPPDFTTPIVDLFTTELAAAEERGKQGTLDRIKQLRDEVNEWQSMTPEEYVDLPRHGWLEEGTSEYHLRNIRWMIGQACKESEERGRRVMGEEVKKLVRKMYLMIEERPVPLKYDGIGYSHPTLLMAIEHINTKLDELLANHKN